MAKQDDYIRYTIRIPAELYEAIKDAAGEKSVNAEITARLETYETILDTVERQEREIRDQWKLLQQLRPSDPLEMADEGAKLLLDENRAWRNAALEAQKTVADLQQKLADATQALLVAQKPAQTPPPITPEAFDKLFAEVQETKKAVLSFTSFKPNSEEEEAEERRRAEEELDW